MTTALIIGAVAAAVVILIAAAFLMVRASATQVGAAIAVRNQLRDDLSKRAKADKVISTHLDVKDVVNDFKEGRL